MTVYLDSSFMVPLYVSEGQSVLAATTFHEFTDPPAVSLLTDLEAASALPRKANSDRGRAGLGMYLGDRTTQIYQQFAVDDAVFRRAQTLTEQYASSYLLRSLDALQIAITLHHGAAVLATFDLRQAEVARALGLRVVPERS